MSLNPRNVSEELDLIQEPNPGGSTCKFSRLEAFQSLEGPGTSA